jgi:hypothetical protein
MYFNTKNYLKSTRNYTIKHAQTEKKKQRKTKICLLFYIECDREQTTVMDGFYLKIGSERQPSSPLYQPLEYDLITSFFSINILFSLVHPSNKTVALTVHNVKTRENEMH